MSDYPEPDPTPPPLPVFNPINFPQIETGGGGGVAGAQGPTGPSGVAGPQGPAGSSLTLRYNMAGFQFFYPSGILSAELAMTNYTFTGGILGFQGRLGLQFSDNFGVVTSGYPGFSSSFYAISGTGANSINPATFTGIVRTYLTQISGSTYTYVLTCTESTVTNENAFTRVNGVFTTNGPISAATAVLVGGSAGGGTPSGRLAISGF